MLELALLPVLLLLVVGILTKWIFSRSRTMKTIPGLSPSNKETGNMEDVAKAGSFHEFLTGLHSRFGPIAGFWFRKTYMVSIASPDLFKQQAKAFDRPTMLFKHFEELTGPNSIQFINGLEARTRRKNYDHLFAHDMMPKYSCYFEECAQKMETKWLEKGQDDMIPLSEECFLYTIQAGLATMFGDEFSDEAKFIKYKNCYQFVWDEMEHATSKGGTRDKQVQEKYDKALEFLRSSTKQAIASRKENDLHLKGNLMIDSIIEKCSNDETVLDDAVTFFVGSFHNTAYVLVWCLYYLALNKDIQDKICEEIKKVVGDEGAVDIHNFNEFVYTTQVLDETLRIAAVSAIGIRVQDSDTELGGHTIPKNTPVVQAIGTMMKDEKLWPLPDKFDPERFSPENRKNRSYFAFVPFGFAGRRKCPGYRFTYWESIIFLVTILRRFDVTLCEGQAVTPVYGFVTHPKDEIWVKVKKRT